MRRRVLSAISCVRDLVMIMVLIAGIPAAVATAEPPPSYQLVWHDEFDSLSVDAPGSGARWLPYFARWGVRHLAGNQDQAIMMADGETAADGETVGELLKRAAVGQHGSGFMHEIENGALRMRAYPLPPPLWPKFWGFPYIGAMVSGEEQHAQRYGYWEVRLRLDNVGQGQHFTVWLLPAGGGWPPEIDMLEVIGRYPDTIFLNGIGAKPPVPMTNWRATSRSRDWLTVGFLWTPDGMCWTINGTTVRQQPDFIADQKLYLLMSWEVHDKWAGPPDATTVWPAQVSVDYVRIYQAADRTGDGQRK